MMDSVTSLLNSSASYPTSSSSSSTSSSSTSSSSTSSSSTSSSSTSSTGGTLGKDDFLKLLVTQLENQDPLNPTDNTEFVSQLAQFSSLEGITNLNTTMSGMASSLTSMQNDNAASLIGKYVKTDGSDINYYSGSQSSFGYTLDGSAASVTVTIKDSAGNTVNTMDMGAQDSGTYDLSWDGKDSSGNALSSGTYSFTVDATDSTGQAVSASTYTIDPVSGVVFDSSTGAASLSVGSKTVTMDEVKAIY